MAKQGKRLKEISSNLEEGRVYDPSEAVELAKKGAVAKFDETVEMVASWYRNFYKDPQNINYFTNKQIKLYQSLISTRGSKWGKNF